MPDAGGVWGEKAKLRSKERREYFREYQKKRYKYRQRVGVEIPENITINLLRERKLKCQLCGKSPTIKQYKGLLIHHKDRNIENNDSNNLIILCRGCHNKVHIHKKEKLAMMGKIGIPSSSKWWNFTKRKRGDNIVKI